MRKIDAMHFHHGTSPGNKCRDCCNLVGGEYHDKHYYKCEAYGLTHSEASDWRLRYDACGLFNKPFDTVGRYPLKPDMIEWRTLLDTMPYALQKVAESFGYAGAGGVQEFGVALRTGQITMAEFNARIIELNGGVDGFAAVAKTATAGIGTAMTNLKTRTVMGVTAIISTSVRTTSIFFSIYLPLFLSLARAASGA